MTSRKKLHIQLQAIRELAREELVRQNYPIIGEQDWALDAIKEVLGFRLEADLHGWLDWYTKAQVRIVLEVIDTLLDAESNTAETRERLSKLQEALA